jgi:hypothetical protein
LDAMSGESSKVRLPTRLTNLKAKICLLQI